MNKTKIIIKQFIEAIRNLKTKSLRQQSLQSQGFTSESDKNCHILTARPVNDITNT